MFHVSHRGEPYVLKAFVTVAAVMNCLCRTNPYRLVQYNSPTLGLVRGQRGGSRTPRRSWQGACINYMHGQYEIDLEHGKCGHLSSHFVHHGTDKEAVQGLRVVS